MILKLNSGIVGKGIELQPGDVVDWQDDGDCKRLIERGLASAATKDEVAAAAGKIKSYKPPKPRPEDAWPPCRLKKLKNDDKDAA